MDQQELYAWESRCIQEEMPYCRAACPLQVDARAFMERMRDGDLAGARKVLERHMPLPGLLARICDHPCEKACLRKDFGGALAVGDLEKFCVQAVGRQSKPLPIPHKDKSIAVLGDDMAALTVAWDLVRKGYQVHVYHQDEQPGAALLARHGVEERSVLEAELELLQRGRIVWEQKTLDPALLDAALAAFDAVFVDASSALGGVGLAQLVPPRESLDPVTLREEGRAVFWGGWDEASPVSQAAEGRRAAATVERHISGASLNAAREKEGLTQTRLKTPSKGLAALARIPADSVAGYDAEQAQAEAGRCLLCECMACVQECAYLQHYKGYPKTYVRQIYNNAAIVKGQHLSNNLINGCSLCGQCEALCPESFSMADLCLSSRREMVERGYMPPAAHEFALEDMDSANSESCSLFTPEAGRDKAAHLFFPGCQLGASRGEQVLRVYEHLRGKLEGGVALGLRCCGVPARWAGREDLFALSVEEIRAEWEKLGRPRLIVACASCLKTLRESQPDMELISLWQLLRKECPVPGADFGLRLSIHDPCAARNDKDWLEAVRSLLAAQGVEAVEPEYSGRETACCGYGGLTWSSQPQVASAMAAHRAGQLEHDAVASCIMCRDRLVEEGKACLHLLDFLFPLPGQDPARRGPGLSARRANRAALKQRVQKEIMGLDLTQEPAQGPILYIDPEVLDKLEARHILLEDLRRVVGEAGLEGAAFRNRSSGHLLASWRPARVTFWVEYAPEEGEQGAGYRVFDAYSHRMVVPGTGNVGEAELLPDYGGSPAFRPAEDRGGVTSSSSKEKS